MPAERQQAQVPLDAQGRFMQAVGCPSCRGTGYRGRKAITELLLMDDALRDMIVARAPLTQLKAHARAHGMRTLRESALSCVLRGESSVDELNRVTLVE
jgi:general secretion pathway protein E